MTNSEQDLSRRDFLVKTGLAGLGAVLGFRRANAQEGSEHPNPTEASHGNGVEVADLATPGAEAEQPPEITVENKFSLPEFTTRGGRILNVQVSRSQVVQEGESGYDLGGTQVKDLLVVWFKDKSGQPQKILVPYALVNPNYGTEGATMFISKIATKSMTFQQPAFENALNQFPTGTKLALGFEGSDQKTHNLDGDPSLQDLIGNWLESNQTAFAVADLISSGNVNKLPKINGVPVLVPFAVSNI